MWTKANCLRALLMLSVLLWCWPSAGICSESRTYQISESELLTLEQNLATLETHNETLKAILSTQDNELTEVLNLLMKSQEELTKLRNELQTARNETRSARESLRIANEELRRAGESFKAYEKERDKAENRLRTQRNVWEALFFIAAGVAAAR